MTVLLYVLGVLLFAVGLAASIALHECGHMVPAKRFGVRVPQFFVGFGKTVWSRRRGETEYGVKAFPLGGYVKLIGMLPPESRVTSEKPGFLGQLVSDARVAESQLLEPGDETRMFYRLPWWKKVTVMAGGPTVNLVIAFLLFAAVFGFQGVPQATTTVGTVSDCVVAVKVGQATPTCTKKDPPSPAQRAKLRSGDKITAFNGTAVTSYDQLAKLIRANGSGSATLTVVRNGHQRKLHTTTAVNSLPSLDPKSNAQVKGGFLGITPHEVWVRQSPVFALRQMGSYTGQTVVALVHLPVRLWGTARAALGLQKRSIDSPVSVVGASRVAGEITSSKLGGIGAKLASLALLLAAVNLFVGMFNFVPLLPLDGGHIAGALFEAVRRAIARLRRRPDPGYADIARMLPIAYVVAGLFLLMTVVLVYADIVAPIRPQ